MLKASAQEMEVAVVPEQSMARVANTRRRMREKRSRKSVRTNKKDGLEVEVGFVVAGSGLCFTVLDHGRRFREGKHPRQFSQKWKRAG